MSKSKRFFARVKSAVKRTARKTAKRVKTVARKTKTVGKKVGKVFVKGVKTIVKKVGKFVKRNFDRLKKSKLGKIVKNVARKTKTVVKKVVKNVARKTKMVGKKVGKAIKRLKKFVKKVGKAVGKAAKKTMSKSKRFLPARVKSAVKRMINTVGKNVKAVVKEVAYGEGKDHELFEAAIKETNEAIEKERLQKKTEAGHTEEIQKSDGEQRVVEAYKIMRFLEPVEGVQGSWKARWFSDEINAESRHAALVVKLENGKWYIVENAGDKDKNGEYVGTKYTLVTKMEPKYRLKSYRFFQGYRGWVKSDRVDIKKEATMDELKKAGGPGYAMLIADYSHPIKSFGTKNCQAAVKRMIKKLTGDEEKTAARDEGKKSADAPYAADQLLREMKEATKKETAENEKTETGDTEEMKKSYGEQNAADAAEAEKKHDEPFKEEKTAARDKGKKPADAPYAADQLVREMKEPTKKETAENGKTEPGDTEEMKRRRDEEAEKKDDEPFKEEKTAARDRGKKPTDAPFAAETDAVKQFKGIRKYINGLRDALLEKVATAMKEEMDIKINGFALIDEGSVFDTRGGVRTKRLHTEYESVICDCGKKLESYEETHCSDILNVAKELPSSSTVQIARRCQSMFEELSFKDPKCICPVDPNSGTC